MTATVNAPVRGGNTVCLVGDQVGSFLVHLSTDLTFTDDGNSKFFWRITHVVSGLRFPWEFRTKKSARAFAKEVESALDWSAITVKIHADKAQWLSGAPTKEQNAAIHKLADKYGAIK